MPSRVSPKSCRGDGAGGGLLFYFKRPNIGHPRVVSVVLGKLLWRSPSTADVRMGHARSLSESTRKGFIQTLHHEVTMQPLRDMLSLQIQRMRMDALCLQPSKFLGTIIVGLPYTGAVLALCYPLQARTLGSKPQISAGSLCNKVTDLSPSDPIIPSIPVPTHMTQERQIRRESRHCSHLRALL